MVASLRGRNGRKIAGVSSASFPEGGSPPHSRWIRPPKPRSSWRSSASETHRSTPIWVLPGPGGSGAGGVSAIRLDLLQRRGAEQAAGPDQHHPDQDSEYDQVGDVAVQVALGPGLDQPDQEAAEHRARNAADTPNDSRCESLQPRKEAHEVVDLAVDQAKHHPGRAAERRADEKSGRDH